MLPVHAEPQVPGEPRIASAAVGVPAAGRGAHRRLPADLAADAGVGRRAARARALAQAGREGRGGLLAEHRRQASAERVAAPARHQLGHPHQRLRQRRQRLGRHLRRAGRARPGEIPLAEKDCVSKWIQEAC